MRFVQTRSTSRPVTMSSAVDEVDGGDVVHQTHDDARGPDAGTDVAVFEHPAATQHPHSRQWPSHHIPSFSVTPVLRRYVRISRDGRTGSELHEIRDDRVQIRASPRFAEELMPKRPFSLPHSIELPAQDAGA